ncbi:MAG TPA: flavin reductase family protein [Longimicrobiales bacterium]|nr:flavin reductase family protein [Longimicrobiales bacterium]
MMDAAEFRRIMGHFAAGVAIVSTRDPATDVPRGLTASAVASVSLDPLLVLACVEHGADSHDCIEAYGSFAVNVLAAGQEALARRFAESPAEHKFEGVAHRTESTGAPVLEGALAWVDCRVWAAYPGGDHTIFVGEVEAGGARDDEPLIYFRGGYGRLSS